MFQPSCQKGSNLTERVRLRVPDGSRACEFGGLRRRIVVNVNGEDRLRLAAIVANRNSPQKHVWRVRIILLTGGTGRRLKRGVFRSIVHLQAAINRPLMNSLLGERASSLRSTGKNEGVSFGLTKNPADLSECEERDQGDTHDDRDGCKSPESFLRQYLACPGPRSSHATLQR